jgi:hypothetical protein
LQLARLLLGFSNKLLQFRAKNQIEMNTLENNRMVVVFAGTTVTAAMVKSYLNNFEIEAFLKDEFMGTLAPWYTSPGGAGSVKVVVRNLDYTKAKELVEEYFNNLK